MNNKRGLSPVIATALLLTLVIILSSIVFLWAKGFVSEQIQKFNQPVELQCEKVEWKINVLSSYTGPILEISNRGNIPIYGIVLKKSMDGNKESEQYNDLKLDIGSSIELPISFSLKNGQQASEIEFIPSIIGSVIGKDNIKKSYVCQNNIKKYRV